MVVAVEQIAGMYGEIIRKYAGRGPCSLSKKERQEITISSHWLRVWGATKLADNLDIMFHTYWPLEGEI